ncbi:MAG: hypothetical protein EP348_10265 [Alphaproteobacteria bacterium]|nr:MAG: hypothetical protein EP348_10265 [Alphaproteobacteria bacterium]
MRLKALLDRLFIDRQIIIRSGGKMSCLHLGRSVQMTSAAALLTFAGLFGYFAVSSPLAQHEKALRSAELATLQAKYDGTASEYRIAARELAATRSELDKQYARLEDILADRAAFAKDLKKSAKSGGKGDEARIRALGEQLASASAAREQLELEVMQTNKALFQTARARDEAEIARQQTARRLTSAQSLLNLYAASKDRIYDDLKSARETLASLKADRDSSRESAERLGAEVSDLESRITRIATENKDLIGRIHDRTSASVMALREIIVLTGLDPDKLLGREATDGQGGPLMALRPDRPLLETEQDYYAQAQKLELSLTQWESLQSLLKHIPLARPVDVGYVTSTYGKRRDPITKRTAYHPGVDISGPMNSPILATAPGVVKFAGRNGAYGNMVAIDHGQGLVTRYGHLKKILVKKGQKVAFRDKIAIMGSTGRSTGRHVHYEVLFEGERQDPLNFIRAGKYAFKASPTIEKASSE